MIYLIFYLANYITFRLVMGRSEDYYVVLLRALFSLVPILPAVALLAFSAIDKAEALKDIDKYPPFFL